MTKRIGLRPADIEIGKQVYYYPVVGKFNNSKAESAIIESDVCEICGTLCCKIDIRSSVVALDNLSEEEFPEKHLSAKKRRAKERYQRFLELDGCWTSDFGEYIKKSWYKDLDD